MKPETSGSTAISECKGTMVSRKEPRKKLEHNFLPNSWLEINKMEEEEGRRKMYDGRCMMEEGRGMYEGGGPLGCF